VVESAGGGVCRWWSLQAAAVSVRPGPRCQDDARSDRTNLPAKE